MSAEADQVGRRFAANIRKHREAAGFSQEELSIMAAVHRTQINLMESGQRLPRLLTFIKLKGALGVSADALLEGIEYVPHVVQMGGLQVNDPEEGR